VNNQGFQLHLALLGIKILTVARTLVGLRYLAGILQATLRGGTASSQFHTPSNHILVALRRRDLIVAARPVQFPFLTALTSVPSSIATASADLQIATRVFAYAQVVIEVKNLEPTCTNWW